MPKTKPRALTGLLCIGMLLCMLSGEVPGQDAPSPVVVSTVVERIVATGHTFVGTVVPLRTSIIGSAADGRVETFLINEGDAVKKGQPLAQLRTGTLQIELASAKAELQLRQEELAELVNGARPEEIAQAKARLDAAKSTREYSKTKYERIQALFKLNGAVTEDELQQTRSLSLKDEQLYLEAKASYDLIVKGPRQERISQAKARVLVQTEQVNLIEDKIKKYTLIAPFDGYVTAEHTEVGAWVGQGDPIAEVIQLSEVDLRVSVLAEHAVHLVPGTSARIEVPALPEEVFTGKVALIVPQADIRSRTFPVKIRVMNRFLKAGPLLKAGTLAQVALPTGEKKQTLLVHKDALVLGGGKPVVFVVDRERDDAKQGMARAVTVELGVADGGLIQVIGSLKKDELVVVLGNERLQPGQAVSISKVLSTELSEMKKQ